MSNHLTAPPPHNNNTPPVLSLLLSSPALSEKEMGWGRRPGTSGCGSDAFIRTLPSKVLHAALSLQSQLTVPARSARSIPEMPLIDAEQKVNLSASACSTFLTVDCNYEIWASLWSPQPDGISIFQLPNEIRPQSNGGWREGSKFVIRQSHFS